LRSADGRSVVKVTHHPLPPHFGEDSDSEIDSDVDIDDEEDSEDEFELDQEEGFKLTPKKGKAANGDAIEEDEDEEDELDDEEDSEDEDDEDFDDDEPVEETNVICALTAGRVRHDVERGGTLLTCRSSRLPST
jgi:FK506-binding nuclear protein